MKLTQKHSWLLMIIIWHSLVWIIVIAGSIKYYPLLEGVDGLSNVISLSLFILTMIVFAGYTLSSFSDWYDDNIGYRKGTWDDRNFWGHRKSDKNLRN